MSPHRQDERHTVTDEAGAQGGAALRWLVDWLQFFRRPNDSFPILPSNLEHPLMVRNQIKASVLYCLYGVSSCSLAAISTVLGAQNALVADSQYISFPYRLSSTRFIYGFPTSLLTTYVSVDTTFFFLLSFEFSAVLVRRRSLLYGSFYRHRRVSFDHGQGHSFCLYLHLCGLYFTKLTRVGSVEMERMVLLRGEANFGSDLAQEGETEPRWRQSALDLGSPCFRTRLGQKAELPDARSYGKTESDLGLQSLKGNSLGAYSLGRRLHSPFQALETDVRQLTTLKRVTLFTNEQPAINRMGAEGHPPG